MFYYWLPYFLHYPTNFDAASSVTRESHFSSNHKPNFSVQICCYSLELLFTSAVAKSTLLETRGHCCISQTWLSVSKYAFTLSRRCPGSKVRWLKGRQLQNLPSSQTQDFSLAREPSFIQISCIVGKLKTWETASHSALVVFQ